MSNAVRKWNDFSLSMGWVTPQFSRGRVDAAGNALINEPLLQSDYETALSVINNWRSSHAYPLQCLKMTLLQRAKSIDPKAIIAQRLKRLVSIRAKLQRFSQMKMSQMQDIGGCRAVVASIHHVERLVGLYEKNILRGAEFIEKYDYIKQPKIDGYRGVHLVYKYRSTLSAHQTYNGLRIEIQLRSRLQHAWATAVETASTFTGQALKSNIGTDQWKRFFAIVGSAFAIRENKPIVPGTIPDKNELVREIRTLSHELKVEILLERWGTAIHYVSQHTGDADAFLLELDPHASVIRVTGFPNSALKAATERYLIAEKEAAQKPGAQAVLVSVKSVQALKSAYPNYYLDSRHFLAAMRVVISQPL